MNDATAVVDTATTQAQNRGGGQGPSGRAAPLQRAGGQQHQKQAEQKAVAVGEPDRRFEPVPSNIRSSFSRKTREHSSTNSPTMQERR